MNPIWKSPKSPSPGSHTRRSVTLPGFYLRSFALRLFYLLPFALIFLGLLPSLHAQGVITQTEPDDTIPTANATGFVAGTSGIKVAYGSNIDGAYGVGSESQTGDFDFYKIDAAAGQTILLDLKNRGLSDQFDSFIAIYSYDGVTATKVAENDDAGNGARSSRLTYTAPAAGTYYIVVSSWIDNPAVDSSLPQDPLTPGTGYGLPGGDGGPYQLIIGLDATSPVVDFDGLGTGNPVYPLRWIRFTGEVSLRQTSSLKITNTGNAPYQITGATITGADATRYQMAGLTLPATLAAGASTTVSFLYTGDSSDATGDATLDLTTNDPFAQDYPLTVSNSHFTGGGRYTIYQVHAAPGTNVDSFVVADALLAGTNAATSATVTAPFVNLAGAGSNTGYFGGDAAFPDTSGSGSNFVTRATGRIFVREAGLYTFRTFADDGMRLKIDDAEWIFSLTANSARYATVDLTAGEHLIEFTQFEIGGGDSAELCIAQQQGEFFEDGEASWELLEAWNPDSDGDGLPNDWEIANGLDPGDATNPNGATGDPDADGASNLAEYLGSTNPQDSDSDNDGLLDGVETKTGIWVSASDTGTDPLKADSDGDGLSDGVEDPTEATVNAAQPGTDPNKKDTDGDTFADLSEVTLGTDPKVATSKPNLRFQTVFAENFDGAGYQSTYAFTQTSGATAPAVDVTGVASHGSAARITANEGSNNNSIAWNHVEAPSSPALRLSFDFRIANVADPADGFGIGLFRTSAYQETGGTNPAAALNWENPFSNGGHPDAVVFGFAFYGTDLIRIAGPAVPGASLGEVFSPFTLSNGVFNRAIITAVTNGPDSTVFTLEVIQDVDGAAIRRTIFSNVVVPGFVIGNEEYRVIAGGRTGGLSARQDIDNVELASTGLVQPYVLSTTATINSAELKLEDHPNSVVNPTSIQATINGTPITVNVSKTGAVTTVTYSTPAGTYLPPGSNVIFYTYSDTNGNDFVATQTVQLPVYKVIPDSLAVPAANALTPGINVNVFQTAQADTAQAFFINYWEIVEGILDGVAGGPYNAAGNLANLSGATNGVFNAGVINYEQEALASGYFTGDTRFPGIPGTTSSLDYFALEATTWVHFPTAGLYTFGVFSDDGFRASYGHEPAPGLEIVGPASGAKILPFTPSLTGVNGGIGAALPNPPIQAKLVLATPILGDVPYTNAAALAGNIAVVERGGGIAFTQKAQYALNAGAVAVVIINETFPTATPLVAGGVAVNIPLGTISKVDGDRIKSLIAANPGGVTARFGVDRSRIVADPTAPADSAFGFIVSQPGLYPLRLAYFEGNGGANLEWYSIDALGQRHLVNNLSDPAALKAYASVSLATGATIQITRSGSQIILNYTGVLQSSSNLSGFTDVPGATSPYTVPAGSPAKMFYRTRD